MLRPYIARLLNGEDLSEDESTEAMSIIMSGQATDAQIAGFLVALRLKGETVEEITGCARAMRRAAAAIEVGDLAVVDTCGTGGDERGTFNVSTVAAIVAAGAGVPVAKHGNRSVSSNCGSADVLERLGVNIAAPIPLVQRCIREAGIGFLFAPLLHKAMKHAIGPRRELGIRTVFNVLGPLTNPAGARRQVLGIFSADLIEKIAGVLHRLGAEKALVVHGLDGLDELSVCDDSLVAEVDRAGVRTWRLSPASLGIPRADVKDLLVDGPEQGAEAAREVLAGKRGPRRDMALLNAAAALYVGGKVKRLQEGLVAASSSIDSGRARAALDQLIALTNS